MTTTYDVFVGNLTAAANEEQIRELFGEFGNIHSMLLKKGDKGDDMYFSFVRYLNESEAQSAMAGLNGKVVNGVPIRCNFNQKRGSAGGKNTQHGSSGSKSGSNNQMGGVVTKVAGNISDIGDFGSGNHNTRSVELSKLGTITVMVTHVESPLKCYVQSLEPSHQQEMGNISEQLSNFCPSAQAIKGKPQAGKIYASRFSTDGLWYRCKVSKELGESESYVDYIDYGNGEAKPNCDIVELLPKLANIKEQALGVMLYGLKPSYNANIPKGTARFMELTDGKELKCQFQAASAKITGPFLPAILTDEEANHDINQVMLDEKYGERRFTNTAPRPVNQSISKPSAQPTHGSQKDGIGNFVKEFGNTLTSLESTAFSWVPTPGQSVPQHMSQPPPPSSMATMASGAGFSSPMVNSGGDPGNSQEIQVIRAEANQMRLDLQRQVERLQRELNKKNEDFKRLQFEQSNIATKMQKPKIFPDVSEIHTVVGKVEKVKLLRQQFPTGEQNCDVIEQGVSLFSDPNSTINVENLEVISNVKSSVDSYNFLQQRIKSASNLEEVADLLPARDEARKQLSNRLTEFHSALSQLPVLQRKKDLEECVNLLRRTYNSYLEVKVLTDLSAEGVTNMYADWKAAKVAEFSEARTKTNTEHNAVNNALLLAQQQLSLGENSFPSEQLSPIPNIDALMNSFQKALVNEISHTNMLESKEDGPKICMMVQSLHQVLQAELSQISSLYELQTTYAQLSEDIEPWLQSKPDVMQINVTRKNIKTLKSKLRHKLADKVDMEEDCPSDDELQDLLTEISKIRKELQTAFSAEDGCLACLNDINENHFPELCLQHPDLGIDKADTFDGLVKFGWSLDHFDVVENDFMGKSSLTKSTFCGEDVVIREYILDEGLGIKKSDVLKRAAQNYPQIKSDKVSKIKAVFFSKTERQVYLVLPYYKQNLTERMMEPISAHEARNVIRDLVGAVKQSHEHRLIHGAIHPNNVFISSDGSALLGDYDFTKKLEQRAEKTYVSRKGLTFAAPEVTARSSVTRATDMYSLGVIAYWLHFPEAATLSEFVKSQENDPLEQLLHYLLNPDPQRRCNAKEALNLPYFNVPEESATSLPLTVSTLSEATESRQMSPKPSNGILKTALSPRNSVSGVAKVSYGDTTIFKMETTSSEDESSVPTMNEEGNNQVEEGPSTPLPCSTMGTPVNTPVEGDGSAANTDSKTAVHDLVTSAAEQAALLAGNEEQEISATPVMSSKEVIAQAESLETEESNGTSTEEPCEEEETSEQMVPNSN